MPIKTKCSEADNSANLQQSDEGGVSDRLVYQA
jgi:hypothetical protein